MDIFKSGDTIVRFAKSDDIPVIAREMRKSDAEEIWASHNHTPFTGLHAAFKNSVICLTIENAGKAIGMFGVVPMSFLGNQGSVWMLAANDFCKIQKKFARRSRAFIKIMLMHYPHLMNMVDIRNRDSVKWLKWCGAKFGKISNFGVEQIPFQYFEFRR